MKPTGLRQPFVLTALCAAMLLPAVSAWAVTDQEILDDVKTTDQIVTNGMGLQGQRYSPLTTLNTDNIKDLRPVWTLSFGGEKQRGQQAQDGQHGHQDEHPAQHGGSAGVHGHLERLDRALLPAECGGQGIDDEAEHKQAHQAQHVRDQHVH